MVELRANSGAGTQPCGRRSQSAHPVLHVLWAGTICGIRRLALTFRVVGSEQWESSLMILDDGANPGARLYRNLG